MNNGTECITCKINNANDQNYEERENVNNTVRNNFIIEKKKNITSRLISRLFH